MAARHAPTGSLCGSWQTPWAVPTEVPPWTNWHMDNHVVSNNERLWYQKPAVWLGDSPQAKANSAASASDAYLPKKQSAQIDKDDQGHRAMHHVRKPLHGDVVFQMVNDADEAGLPSWRFVDFSGDPALVGAGESVVRLRYGVIDERVVLKRVTARESQLPVPVVANVLSPIALVRPEEDKNYLAYAYCQHGTLAEWISKKQQLGAPPKFTETLKIFSGVLQAAFVFITSGIGFNSLRTDDIFLNSELQPRVRIGYAKTCGKWLAPQELRAPSSSPESDAWPVVVFRLGLILYCLGAQTPDPYPDKSAHAVLQDLRLEASGAGCSLRPDFSKYTGPRHLYTLMEQCLSPDSSECPDLETLTETVLDIEKRLALAYQ